MGYCVFEEKGKNGCQDYNNRTCMANNTKKCECLGEKRKKEEEKFAWWIKKRIEEGPGKYCFMPWEDACRYNIGNTCYANDKTRSICEEDVYCDFEDHTGECDACALIKGFDPQYFECDWCENYDKDQDKCSKGHNLDPETCPEIKEVGCEVCAGGDDVYYD